MKITDVYCIENFSTNNDVTFSKNCRYKVIIYPELRNIFYVAKVPDSKENVYAAYPLDYVYINKFINLKELRKKKLEELNEKRR